MNSQMPYGFMPQLDAYQNNEIRMLSERVENLERRVKKLEKNSNNYPTPLPYMNPNSSFNTQEMPNNYMM